MKRRSFLSVIAAAASVVVLPNLTLPSFSYEGGEYELVIVYDLRNGRYKPNAQKIELRSNNSIIGSWKVTSSRDTILFSEGQPAPAGFDDMCVELLGWNNILPNATLDDDNKWGFDLHYAGRGWIAIHATLGNQSDETGSDLCFRTFGFQSLRKEITALQKQGVITWRFEHLQ